jgi:hypothetical protein
MALDLCQNIFPGGGTITYEEMAKAFYEYFKELYERVVRHAEQNLDAAVNISACLWMTWSSCSHFS